MMRGAPALATPFEDVAAGMHLLWGLPSFFRHPIGSDRARAALRCRLARREADFLSLVERAVYQHVASPYRQLLHLAGCEYGDLERLVRLEGLEGALDALARRGMYLTVEELKGRRPATRGSAVVAVDPAGLRNPRPGARVPARSGGSRGAAAPVTIDLASIRDRAVNKRLTLDARGGSGWVHAVWGVPGGGAVSQLLGHRLSGATPARWFSQIRPSAPGLHHRYRWSARVLRWGSVLAGSPLPRPQHVPVERPLPIADWMAGVLRSGRTPHLFTHPSSAVRLCQGASGAGLDLRGAQFTVGGEPITDAKLTAIERAGGAAVPTYGSIECGQVAYGCLAPAVADDLHVFHDLHALIQLGAADGPSGLPPQALLVSSLRPAASLILLNVSLGDQGVLERRACGCPLEQLGWGTHLHTIRSFEKLTAEGGAVLDLDVIRVLEEALPSRFGGAPTDYQLLEDEDDEGRPRLRLLVHPALGPLDADAVRDAFLTAVGPGSGPERLTGLLWRGAGLLRVERQAPRTTASSKILHLYSGGRTPKEAAK